MQCEHISLRGNDGDILSPAVKKLPMLFDPGGIHGPVIARVMCAESTLHALNDIPDVILCEGTRVVIGMAIGIAVKVDSSNVDGAVLEQDLQEYENRIVENDGRANPFFAGNIPLASMALLQ